MIVETRPAFPSGLTQTRGISDFDYFAACALIGIKSRERGNAHNQAEEAYQAAAAMMLVRKQYEKNISNE